MDELDYMPPAGVFVCRRVARKAHQCSMSGCIIQPGQRYWEVVNPPWVTVQDDPEYPGHPLGEWETSRTHSHGEHNKDGWIDLYHRTTPEAKAEILRTREWRSQENHGKVYFSNRIDGQAAGYGDAVIHIRLPIQATELDDEFPDGEKHYRVRARHAALNIVEE